MIELYPLSETMAKHTHPLFPSVCHFLPFPRDTLNTKCVICSVPTALAIWDPYTVKPKDIQY